MLPEEKARVKIDKQLNNAGWDIVDRKDYLPNYAMAVKEALMQGGKESDYLLFVDNKAIGVVEAKKESEYYLTSIRHHTILIFQENHNFPYQYTINHL